MAENVKVHDVKTNNCYFEVSRSDTARSYPGVNKTSDPLQLTSAKEIHSL